MNSVALGTNVVLRKLVWGTSDTASLQNDYADGFDVIIGADIIYIEDSIQPMFVTVSAVLSSAPTAVFLLAYARRNVPIQKVLDCAQSFGFGWECPAGAEGIYLFRRNTPA